MEQIPCSDSSLLVRFGETIDPVQHRQVLALLRALAERREPGIVNLHPAYASLLIEFDPLRIGVEEISALLAGVDLGTAPDETTCRRHEIPVCYDPELGPDLADVSDLTGLSGEEIVALHTAPEYLIYFLGFSPGFAYLGGLPAALIVPRLASPRKLVPAGSVAIGGEQTGIYPKNSPGGWRIIGRTPARLFTPSDEQHPTLFQPGDRVRFSSISRSRFEEISRERRS